MRLMRTYFLKVLQFGGLFLFQMSVAGTTVSAKRIYSDVFVYKVSDTVYSLKDLNQLQMNLTALNCYYPESILVKFFKTLILKGKESSIFVVKDYTQSNYSPHQREYFKKAIEYHKLKFYSDSHKVSVNKSIVESFDKASRQTKCSREIFNLKNQSFTSSFEEVMKMEIFLRSRYLPEKLDAKNPEKDIKQALVGIKNLLNSIDKQVSEEVFW